MGRTVPWISWEEWWQVKTWLLSGERREIEQGTRRVAAWRARGRLPLGVDITASLLEIMLQDGGFPAAFAGAGADNHPSQQSQHTIRLQYAMALVRMVNGITDSQQKGKVAHSVTSLADAAGLSRLLVDLRHEATHNELPSMAVLRLGAQEALGWLTVQYWQRQADHCEACWGQLQGLLQQFLSSWRAALLRERRGQGQQQQQLEEDEEEEEDAEEDEEGGREGGRKLRRQLLAEIRSLVPASHSQVLVPALLSSEGWFRPGLPEQQQQQQGAALEEQQQQQQGARLKKRKHAEQQEEPAPHQRQQQQRGAGAAVAAAAAEQMRGQDEALAWRAAVAALAALEKQYPQLQGQLLEEAATRLAGAAAAAKAGPEATSAAGLQQPAAGPTGLLPWLSALLATPLEPDSQPRPSKRQKGAAAPSSAAQALCASNLTPSSTTASSSRGVDGLNPPQPEAVAAVLAALLRCNIKLHAADTWAADPTAAAARQPQPAAAAAAAGSALPAAALAEEVGAAVDLAKRAYLSSSSSSRAGGSSSSRHKGPAATQRQREHSRASKPELLGPLLELMVPAAGAGGPAAAAAAGAGDRPGSSAGRDAEGAAGSSSSWLQELEQQLAAAAKEQQQLLQQQQGAGSAAGAAAGPAAAAAGSGGNLGSAAAEGAGWRRAEGWKPCPIGMCPSSYGTHGSLPCLDWRGGAGAGAGNQQQQGQEDGEEQRLQAALGVMSSALLQQEAGGPSVPMGPAGHVPAAAVVGAPAASECGAGPLQGRGQRQQQQQAMDVGASGYAAGEGNDQPEEHEEFRLGAWSLDRDSLAKLQSSIQLLV